METDDKYKEEIAKLTQELGLNSTDAQDEIVKKEPKPPSKGSEVVEKKDGYMTEEQYKAKFGNLDGFKTKDKFDADASFFRKIEAQNKKIDELIEFNRQQMELNKQVEKASYEKALRDLQKSKLEAIAEADVDRVLAIEQEAEAVDLKVKSMAPAAPQEHKFTPEEIDFRERNSSWLNGHSEEDKRMQLLAKHVFEYTAAINPGIDSIKMIETIEEEMRLKFPDRFENPNQRKAPSTLTSTTSAGAVKSVDERLSQRQLDFIKQAKRLDKTFKTEDYIKQLELTGQI